jgi:hypothetical protein
VFRGEIESDCLNGVSLVSPEPFYGGVTVAKKRRAAKKKAAKKTAKKARRKKGTKKKARRRAKRKTKKA